MPSAQDAPRTPDRGQAALGHTVPRHTADAVHVEEPAEAWDGPANAPDAPPQQRMAAESPMGSLPHPYDSAAPVEHCLIADAPAVPTVVVAAHDMPTFELEKLFDAAFAALVQAIDHAGLRIIGPAFLMHHRRPVETADVELGFPVNAPLPGPVPLGIDDQAVPSELPGGSVAVRSHIGSYGRLPESWGSFIEDIGESDHRMRFPFWEFYVSVPTPSADPKSLRTDMVTLLD